MPSLPRPRAPSTSALATAFATAFAAALLAICALAPAGVAAATKHAAPAANLRKIQHIVVIYAENRSFDNLYGAFPGADGIANAKPDKYLQRDRNGDLLKVLPPVWKESEKKGEAPSADPAFPKDMPNKPFAIDDPQGANLGLNVATRDLWHRFYQHQAQLDGGKLDKFAAWSDAGGLTMGHYNGASLEMWQIAKEFTLADHFFMGAFGGSFLNHFWLICACTPQFKDAPEGMRSKLDDQGRLLVDPSSPPSALAGPPKFVADKSITPDGFAVNTMQPAYQPSGLGTAEGDKTLADPKQNPLPPQTATTIGDTLSAANVSWAWYSGAWNAALDDAQRAPNERQVIYHAGDGSPNFQAHHQPFNYFANYAPGTAARKQHLKDAQEFLDAIDHGTLESVAFYKPPGKLTEHPGYTDVVSGDKNAAEIVRRIQASPIWPSTVVIVTYDENGGLWDHVPPPKGDRWGPGSRIAAIIVSPFARKHFVDKTVYDTTSILKLITRRFDLAPLPGVRAGAGDLTAALQLATTGKKPSKAAQ